MTQTVTKLRPKESFRYLGPLNVELEVRNYEQLSSPSTFEGLGGSTVRGEWKPVALGASEVGMLPLQAFISGMQLVLGASASSQRGWLMTLGGGQINGGSFTIIPLDADDDLVSERMTEITGARALLQTRLDALSQLSEGWLDGEGLPPTPSAVEVARHLIWVLFNHNVPRPRIAPTPEGGVEAEWSVGDREVSVTFEPDGSLYGNAVDVATGEISEPALTSDDHQAVAEFVLGA